MREAIKEKQDLEFKPVEDIPTWAAFHPETAKKDGVEFIRKRGTEIIYKKVSDGYECNSCGGEIMSATVAHPIWDGPFPLSGSGKVKNEEVPYFPNCEEEPNFNGSPITKD